MYDIVRDAAFGQLVRWLTNNRVFLYPEERADFVLPSSYGGEAGTKDRLGTPGGSIAQEDTTQSEETHEKLAQEEEDKTQEEAEPTEELDKIPTLQPIRTGGSNLARLKSARTVGQGGLERIGSRTVLQQAETAHDLETALSHASLEKGPTQPIEPAITADGKILVDWWDTDDAANPLNWSSAKKGFITFVICTYTTSIYIGSAIITPSEVGIMQDFGVSSQVAALALSMFVLGYGLGALPFSPLAEIPSIGRNPPYVITFCLYVILIVPTALVENMPGLVVLRFLLGFFGSPCLATGGASLGDIYSFQQIPYMLCLWAFAATCGPALGPIISGFSVPAETWRWALWEMLWLAGPTLIVFFVFIPETFPDSILLQRAKRLRKLTGNPNLVSQSEINQANMSTRKIATEAMYRPFQLIILDPSIAFVTLYTALIYGIYYSFFEVFPIVYIETYGFNIGEMGLTFLSVTVGVVLAIALYWAWNYWYVDPSIRSSGLGEPERRLLPALVASFLIPIGLFIFAWTSRASIHWIVSVIGIFLVSIGIFIVMQCIFIYLAFCYPQYTASLFAGNDAARSLLASGAIHFSSPLFAHLGVGRGTSLLAALTAGCVIGVFALYFFGASLRARSRFTVK